MSLRVHLERRARDVAVDAAAVKRFARDVLSGEGIEDAEVTLVLSDDRSLHELNARFRGMDRPTDVLAFPAGETGPAEGGGYLGDVVISVERARAQAPRFGNDVDGELARLVAHGLLHLLGYDHHAPADGRRMKAAERRALARRRPGALARASRGRA